MLVFSQCNFNRYKAERILLDLPQIKERGELVACTDYTSTYYFIYRGEPMGFQYELLRLFASHMKLKLRINVTNNMDKAYKELNSFHAHLLAIDLSPNNDRNSQFNFSNPFIETRPVLVQRRPEKWYEMDHLKLDSILVRTKKQLSAKTIYIQKNTAYLDLLKNIESEIGNQVYIVEDDQNDIERLIQKVSNGEIDYTVCDEHVALVNQTYYSNIDVRTALSEPVGLSWAVRKDSRILLDSINNWMKKFMKTNEYVLLYNKYYRNPRSQKTVQKEYLNARKGIISGFDEVIKSKSRQIGWDWRLLASLIYQESQFNPYAKAWTGAFGLMQLMPYNAGKYGLDSIVSIPNQVQAGVNYIKELDRIFSPFIREPNEKIKFILAAYNAGIGQIIDARNLARKYGKNPYIWENNVDTFILLKSNPKYYLDPVTSFGYCRGIETYEFVPEVLKRYEHYRNIIKE